MDPIKETHEGDDVADKDIDLDNPQGDDLDDKNKTDEQKQKQEPKEGDDDFVRVPKNEYNALKRIAQKKPANQEIPEETVRKVMAEDKAVEALKSQYPDLDIEKVRTLSKDHNLSIEDAAKLVIPDKQPQARSMGGKVDTKVTTMSQKDFDALPIDEYKKVHAKWKAGEMQIVR